MKETEALLHTYREAGKAYAKAKATAVYQEHRRHVVLAHEMALAEANGAKSVAAQDRDARNSAEYQAHLEKLYKATQEENFRRADLQAAEYEIEVWRTEQANMRQERKAYAA